MAEGPGLDLYQVMSREGEFLVGAVVNKILTGPFTPNAPSTIKRKKSSKPLLDKGDLVGSIEKMIEIDGNTVTLKVGIFDPVIAPIGSWNEFGVPHDDSSLDPAPGQRIPARSFLRSTYDENIEGVARRLEDTIAKKIEIEWMK